MERRCGIFFAVVLAVAVCFAPASCALFGDDESGVEESVEESAGALTASVSGSVEISGVAPGVFRSSAARTALPSLGEEISYSVEASGGGSPYKADVDAENLSFSFGELSVGEGGTEYAITATGKSGGVAVLFGEVTETLKPGDAFFCEVPVKPYMKSGTGSVNLEISVGETEIRSCAVNIPGEDSAIPPPVYSGGKITWSAELDSGCYDAVFSFYNTESASDGNRILLYEFRESVHVCKSLVTDSWFGSSAYITTDGKCVITKALVDKFALSRIYVSSRKEDSKETGTRAEPYKSVARAMNALLDKDTDYTILVDGELAGAQEIPVTLRKDGSGAYKAKTLSIKGAGAGAKIDGNKEGTALTIETDVPVTIENITITGGETAGNGGGIYLASASSVTISENTEIISNDAKDGGGIFNAGTLYLCGGVISKNTASNCGGGVYSTGTMFMYGSAVIGDSSKTTAATKSESTYSNKAAAAGGGIYSTGNLYLGFSSAGTEAVLTGGVYYNFAKNTGGIYQIGANSSKEFKLNSGSVFYNAERGMYVGKGKFTMTGGIVSGNTALDKENEDSWRGAGIYVGAGCTAVISGGTISSNEAAVKGGGIHIAQSSSKLTIEGGTISGNTAGSYGSGISMDDGSLKMQGGAKIDSSNDVYLPSGKVITITGELTGEAPIATITPAVWKRGTTIVQVDGETVTDATDFAGCFAVTQDGWDKCISGDKKSIYITAPIYVAPNGDDGESTPGTRANPFKTIKRGVQLLSDAVGGDHTIYIDGKLVELQELPADFSKTTADSLTIKGTNNSSMIDAEKKGTALTIKTEVPVKIINFTIKNGKSDSTGGGIYIEEKKADVTLGDGTVSGGVLITANEAQEGGGIYNKGKLTIKYGVNITSNSAKDGSHSQGGGVCNEGTFVMEDGAISSNSTEVTTDGYGGGGIANISAASSVYILGGAIARNSTTKYGGGLLNYQGKIFVSGNATIGGSGTDKNTADDRGGGIYSEGGYCYLGYDGANSEKEWTGKIAGNTAVKGGGIYSSSAVITMNSGSVESNTADEKGGAFYEGDASQLKMGGKASILSGNEQKNDVYLEHEKTITVSGSLESENLAALITIPEADYTAGTQVLDGDAIADECYKFRVRKPDSKPEMLFVGSDGKLVPIIGFSNGANYGTVTNTGTEENPGDGLEYDVYKYSYIDYSNIKMSIVNPYENVGYSMEVTIDDETPSLNTNINDEVLEDGFHTIQVKLEKSGAETMKITKRVYAGIRKVKITLYDAEIKNFSKDYFKGGVYINGREVRRWNDWSDFSDTHFNTYSFSETLDKKDSDFICSTADAYMASSSKGKNSSPLRDAYREYKLSDLIGIGYIEMNSGTYNNGGHASDTLTLAMWYTKANAE